MLIYFILGGNWFYLLWLLIVNIKLGQSTNGSLLCFDYDVFCAYILTNQVNKSILCWISQTAVHSINVWHFRFQKLFKLLNLKFYKSFLIYFIETFLENIKAKRKKRIILKNKVFIFTIFFKYGVLKIGSYWHVSKIVGFLFFYL